MGWSTYIAHYYWWKRKRDETDLIAANNRYNIKDIKKFYENIGELHITVAPALPFWR
jgi:hypothetical protein